MCYISNHTAVESLGWIPPLTALTGQTVDTSTIFSMPYRTKVYYLRQEASFPSDSSEALAYFVGFAEHVGHQATYKLLTEDTRKIIYRSRVRLADEHPNRVLEPNNDSENPQVLKSKGDTESLAALPTLDNEELIGRSFLREPEDNGERHRATITRVFEDHLNECSDSKPMIKLRLKIGNEEVEELVAYNQLMEAISGDTVEESQWKFKEILDHAGPLNSASPTYNGSSYNVLIAWESGEVTWEPLSQVGVDDPVTCALYAKKNGLLEKPGWKKFRKIARRQQTLIRMAKQSKLKSYRTAPVYQYGVQVPRDHADAVKLDEANGNTKWVSSEKLEIEQLNEFKTFQDKGHRTKPPPGYNVIRMHFVYAVKHDGRHKSRLVAGGHMTPTPLESVYSGVVSLRSIRLIAFAAELNGLQLFATDVSNAYLEATTSEKVCFIAGPEFGELEGHLMIIYKACYGLKTSGLRWHERFAAVLRDMGFVPCYADPDVWMRDKGDHYEYIGVYVNDLCICSKDAGGLLELLMNKYKFGLKGSGPMTYHLGCDFTRDADGVLHQSPG